MPRRCRRGDARRHRARARRRVSAPVAATRHRHGDRHAEDLGRSPRAVRPAALAGADRLRAAARRDRRWARRHRLWRQSCRGVIDSARTKVFTMTRRLGHPGGLRVLGLEPRTSNPAPAWSLWRASRGRSGSRTRSRPLVGPSSRLVAFPDHHRVYAARSRSDASGRAHAAVGVVVTTEKDAMRLLPLRPLVCRWRPCRWMSRSNPDVEFRAVARTVFSEVRACAG